MAQAFNPSSWEAEAEHPKVKSCLGHRDLDVVGDGMPCPPSPLLFDPSLTLEDHSVTESAGDAVGIFNNDCQLGSLM